MHKFKNTKCTITKCCSTPFSSSFILHMPLRCCYCAWHAYIYARFNSPGNIALGFRWETHRRSEYLATLDGPPSIVNVRYFYALFFILFSYN